MSAWLITATWFFRRPSLHSVLADAVVCSRCRCWMNCGQFPYACSTSTSNPASSSAVSVPLTRTRRRVAKSIATMPTGSPAAPAWSELTWGAEPSRVARSGHSDVLAVLSRIAEQGVELFTGPRRASLRACHAPGCVLYFVRDHPRREWCSAGCGKPRPRRTPLPAAPRAAYASLKSSSSSDSSSSAPTQLSVSGSGHHCAGLGISGDATATSCRSRNQRR